MHQLSLQAAKPYCPQAEPPSSQRHAAQLDAALTAPEVLPYRIVTIGSENSTGGFFPQGLLGNLRRCLSGMHQALSAMWRACLEMCHPA